MIKWISSILIILLGIVISIILYLSTVGIETKSFNNLIENKVKNYNQNLLLKFDKVKLLLDPKKLDLKIKLIQPKIVSKNNELLFRKVNSNLSLKSYIKGEFALKNIELKLSMVKSSSIILSMLPTIPPVVITLSPLFKLSTIFLCSLTFFC